MIPKPFNLIIGDGDKRRDIGAFIALHDGIITSLTRDTATMGVYYVEFLAYMPTEEVSNFRDTLMGMIDIAPGGENIYPSNEPNCYYKVLLKDPLSISETLSEFKITGKFSYTIPDKLKHSMVIKTVDANSGENVGTIIKDEISRSITCTINNEGTAPTYPIIKITSTSNTGYYGIAHPNGQFRVGNDMATVDGANVYTGGTEAQRLIDIRRGDQSTDKGWGQFKDAHDIIFESPMVPTVAIDDGKVGYIDRTTLYNVKGLGVTKMGRAIAGYKWSGGALYIDLPKDESGYVGAKDFRADFNIKVWEQVTGQTGFMSIVFADKDHKPIATYDVAKDSGSTGELHTKFWIGYNDMKQQIDSHANNGEANQAIKNEAYNNRTGGCYVMKENNTITFGYNGRPYSFKDTAYANKEVAQVFVVAGVYNYKSKGNLNTLCLESFQFTKLNAKRYDMTPNKYQKGSVITIDNEEGQIFFSPDGMNKGILAQSELMQHDEFFSLPKGKSQIKMVCSDWGNSLPDVSIDFRESWK